MQPFFQGSINYRALDPALEGKADNSYSQYGEDGLIDAVLQRIGVANSWCFEVGASDGLFYSNTLRLRNAGWSAVLMEENNVEAEALWLYKSDGCHIVHEHITDLDKVLSRFGAPKDLDLGVIDIDGQDYWLWHDMRDYRPRIMLVEFHWKRGDDYIPPRDSTERLQAGRNAITALGESKGYIPVAETHVNRLFVQEELWNPLS
jgi:hypothetical protein